MLRISVRWKRALIALGLVLSPSYLPVCVILMGQRGIYMTEQCGPAEQFDIPGNPGSGLFSGCSDQEWNHGLLFAHMNISARIAIAAVALYWGIWLLGKLIWPNAKTSLSAPPTQVETKTEAAPRPRPFPVYDPVIPRT